MERKKKRLSLLTSSGDETTTDDDDDDEEDTDSEDTSPEESSTYSSTEDSEDPSDDSDYSSESTISDDESSSSDFESLKKPLRQRKEKAIKTKKGSKTGSSRRRRAKDNDSEGYEGSSHDGSSGRLSTSDSFGRKGDKIVLTKKHNKKKKKKQGSKIKKHKTKTKESKHGKVHSESTKKTKKKQKGSKRKPSGEKKKDKKQKRKSGLTEEYNSVEEDEDKQGKRSLLPTTKNGRTNSHSKSSDGDSSVGSIHKWDDLLKRGFNGLMSKEKALKGGDRIVGVGSDAGHEKDKHKKKKKEKKKEGERRPSRTSEHISEGTESSNAISRGEEEEKVNILGGSKRRGSKKKEDKTAYVKVHQTKRKDKAFSRMYKVHEIGEEEGGHVGAVWAIEFSLDGNYMASGGSDSIVRVWVLSPEISKDDREDEGKLKQFLNKKKVYNLKGHTADILALSWSNNNFLVSASMDNTVRLWHTSCEGSISCFRHNDFVTSVAFHPTNNKVFMSGGLDKRLCVWNIPMKRVIHTTTVDDMVTAATFLTPSTDGNLIAVGTGSGRLLIYDMEGYEEGSTIGSSVAELQQVKEVYVTSNRTKMPKKITGLTVSSGGKYMLVTANDSSIRLYKTETFELLCTYTGSVNKEFQISAAWSKTSDYIISGAEDPHVRIWEAEQGLAKKDRVKPTCSFAAGHSSMVTTARFVPKSAEIPGEVIVLGGLDGVLHILHCMST